MPKDNTLFWVMMVSTFGICLMFFLVFVSKIPQLPIFSILGGVDSGLELAKSRSAATNAFTGRGWLFFRFMVDLPLFLLVVTFLHNRHGLRWKTFFGVLLGYNIFISIAFLQKAPLINLIITLLAAYFIKRGRINFKLIGFFSLASFGLLFAMFHQFMGLAGRGAWVVISGIFHRTFIVTIQPLFFYFLFSDQHPLLYGRSFPNPGQLLPFEHFKLSSEIMAFAHPHLLDLGISGSMPTVFFAEYMVNFGIWAALFSMPVLGFIIKSVDNWLIGSLIRHNDLMIAGLFVYLMRFFSKYTVTSSSGMLLDFALIIPVTLVIVIQTIRTLIHRYLTHSGFDTLTINPK